MRITTLLDRFAADFRLHNSAVPEAALDEICKQVEASVTKEAPPRVAFIGQTGVGKSSTLNALFNAGLEISHTTACTQREAAVQLIAQTVQGENGVLVAYDMPGLGESRSSRDKHFKTYERVVKLVDTAVWILDAQNRAMEEVQGHLNATIGALNPMLLKKMVFALNKIDLVHPGEMAWHPRANLPSEEQAENIAKRIEDVRKLVREAVPGWSGEVLGYSTKKRYGLPQLFRALIDATAEKRRWVLGSRMSLANFLELVDPSFLQSGNARPPAPAGAPSDRLKCPDAAQTNAEAPAEHFVPPLKVLSGTAQFDYEI